MSERQDSCSLWPRDEASLSGTEAASQGPQWRAEIGRSEVVCAQSHP